MRWVYQNPAREGERLTEGRRNCRELQQTDLVEFMRQLKDLEKAQAARRAAPTGPNQPSSGESGSGSSTSSTAPDPGSARIQALIAELRARLKPFSANP
jgi:hypothetical protein